MTAPVDVYAAAEDDDVVLLAPEEESVPEDDTHRVLVDLLAAGVAACFADRDDVAVFSRLAWFPDRDDTRTRLDPDVMVAFGRPPGRRKSYKQWVEDDVAPAVVIEVRSEDDTDAGYRRRLDRARTFGVREAVLISPYGPGGVSVEHLVVEGAAPGSWRSAGVSVRADQPLEVVSLGLRFAGGDTLDVRDDGEPWRTTAETFLEARAQRARADAEALRADVAQERADAAQRRADEEQRRADEEQRRADLLEARLRAAGLAGSDAAGADRADPPG